MKDQDPEEQIGILAFLPHSSVIVSVFCSKGNGINPCLLRELKPLY